MRLERIWMKTIGGDICRITTKQLQVENTMDE
jgi:hypothetical protein